jgi:hypothetical protein
MSAEMKVIVWREWLRDYWQMRIDSLPRPITPNEGRQLLEWLSELADVFGEASDCARRTPTTGAGGAFYVDFRDSGLPSSHPGEALDVLVHVLKGEGRPSFFSCPEASDIFRAVQGSGATDPVRLRDASEELLRLGCGRVLDTDS